MLQPNRQLPISHRVKWGMDKKEEPTTPATEAIIKKKKSQAVFLNRMMGTRPPCGGCRK